MARLLLVEDEPMLRQLARTVLEASGYVILEASNGREGLALCQAHQGPIDLLLTDAVMPELGGGELAAGARRSVRGTGVRAGDPYPLEPESGAPESGAS